MIILFKSTFMKVKPKTKNATPPMALSTHEQTIFGHFGILSQSTKTK